MVYTIPSADTVTLSKERGREGERERECALGFDVKMCFLLWVMIKKF